MIELRAIERCDATQENVDPRCQYYIQKNESVEIKPGDEVLLLISGPGEQSGHKYGVALRLTDKSEPDENEIVIQYGERIFVGQKLPEFI